MKTRLLPDQDLARIAPMPREQKLVALRRIRFGRPPYSYAPVRASGLDILGVSPGPMFLGERTAISIVELNIIRVARSAEELSANIEVARGLHRFAEEQEILGKREEFRPFPVGLSHAVSYWYPAVVSIAGQITIPFIDFRRAKTLTADARRFIFSVMHERIRVSDPETYGDVRLGVISFTCPDSTTRIARLHTDEGIRLHDFDTLDGMVRDTYQLWNEVLREWEDDARRATGTGPLGI